MRFSARILLAALLLFCGGCSRTYVVKLTNGTKLTTIGKPKLDGVYCAYKNAKGEIEYIPQGRVMEIVPASVAAEEEKNNKNIKPTKN